MNARFSKLLLSVVLVVAVVLGIVPFAGAQEGPKPAKVEFSAYEGNPILSRGSGDDWDAQSIHDPSMVIYDELYYMFYGGDHTGWTGAAIGYATSPDGLTWEKYSENPVFEADGTGFDAGAVVNALITLEGDTWVLYYLGQAQYGSNSTSGIGRATAPSPSGPWTREAEPVLTQGILGDWDYGGIAACSVIATSDGYVLYYLGGGLSTNRDLKIGMATSPDGIHWSKYNDPATSEAPYANSDPVMQPGPEGWDTVSLGKCQVLAAADGWEMFFSGKGAIEGSTASALRIGYATSEDGIHWTKYANNPILTPEDDPAEPAYAYVDLDTGPVIKESAYRLYYDYLWQFGGGIGVATGTVTRE